MLIDTQPASKFYDTRLPFGLRRPPHVFTELTQAARELPWLLQIRTISLCTWMISCALTLTMTKLTNHYRCCYNYCETSEFWLITPQLTFLYPALSVLGIELDPIYYYDDNLAWGQDHWPQEWFEFFLSNTKVTKRALQSLAGKLNIATRCIYGGIFHLWRILGRINDCGYKLVVRSYVSNKWEDIYGGSPPPESLTQKSTTGGCAQ